MQGVLKGRHLKVTDGKSIEQKELEAPQISHRGNAQLGDQGAVAKNEGGRNPLRRELGTQKFSIIHMFISWLWSVIARCLPSGEGTGMQASPTHRLSDSVCP